MKGPSSESSYVAYLYFATILSAQKMFRKNPDLIEFTEKTDHHEPNLSFHFAIEMWQYLPWLNCDFDVKKTAENKRPDVIFHHRGTCDENLLVVEIKRERSGAVDDWECSADKNKIREFWFNRELHYRYGISLILSEETFEFAFCLMERFTGASFDFGPQRFDELEFDFIEEILTQGAYKGIDSRRPEYQTVLHELEMFLGRDFGFYPNLCA